jgi:hypothetical protein
MSDPRPLIHGEANEFEAVLLRAGRSDELPSTSRRQIMTGLGIGGGILSASTVASGVKATSAKGVFSALGLGAVGAVAVGAVAVWTGVSAVAPVHPVETKSPVVNVVAPAPSPRVAPAPVDTQVEVPTAPIGVTEPLAAKAPVRAHDRTPETLSLELSALEQARAALGRRDYGAALRLLDDYARRFPKRRLDSEATVLRIETLAARGDRAAAVRLGNQFLATHANGPYARRVKSLIGESDSRSTP